MVLDLLVMGVGSLKCCSKLKTLAILFTEESIRSPSQK